MTKKKLIQKGGRLKLVTNQAYLFLIFIINGFLIGLLFDFFRILRRSFKTKDTITYIQDIIFWILTGFIILYSTFTFNNGEIRIFMFVAIILGIIFYITLISSYIIKINIRIINFIKITIAKITNTVLLPFQFIYKKLIKPVNHFKGKISNLNKKIYLQKQNFLKKIHINLKNDKENYENPKNIIKN